MYYNMNIVSVDDNAVNLLLVEALTKDMGMQVKSFESAKDALAYMAYNQVDIVLTDYMMPDMHGIDFIKNIRKNNADIPIVMITAISDDNNLKLEALQAGATEFLNKPLNPTEFKVRLMNLINLRKAQLLLQDKALLLEEEVRKAVRLVEEREHEALYVLGRASEYKDLDTAAHINRVAAYSVLILNELGGNIYEQEIMFHSAPLHDIGKMGIPDNILTKPGRFTAAEFEIMKKHPIIGYEMLKEARSPYLKQGAEISLTHHEKFNGSGYPYGLKEYDIPLSGRILAVADVFDALTSVRPYKEAWSTEQALELLVMEKGTHFDPKLIDVFVDNQQEVVKIFSAQQDGPISMENLNLG